jgi:hypothetical protein
MMAGSAINAGKVSGMREFNRRSLWFHRFRRFKQDNPHGNHHLIFGFLPHNHRNTSKNQNQTQAQA